MERDLLACELGNIIIGGSMFTRKRTQKSTRVLPDHFTENPTDHICIGKRHTGGHLKRESEKGSRNGI